MARVTRRVKGRDPRIRSATDAVSFFRLRVAWIMLSLAACGDTSVTLALQLPGDVEKWDTSCVDTIEVFTDGGNYPADLTDDKENSFSVTPSATLAGLEAAIRGKIDIPIPGTGLSGVELYGWSGTPGFNNPTMHIGEQLFSAFAPALGQDTLDLKLVPTVNCIKHTLLVRPLDLVKYVTPLAVATPPAPDCAAAALPDDGTVVQIGSLSPARYEPGLFYWGAPTTASLSSGGTTLNGPTTMGPESCLATRIYIGAAGMPHTASCAQYSTGACGKSGELELPYIDPTYAMNSTDEALSTQYGGMTVGVVVHSNGTPGQNVPVAGAQVVVLGDASGTAKVQYVDIQSAGKKLVPRDGGTATTSSGMFIIYSNDLLSVKVTAGAQTKTVQIGAQTPLNENNGVASAVTVLL